GDFREACEQSPVPANQRQAIQQNRQKRRGQKKIDLPLDAVIDGNDLLPGLLLVFGVLDQESSDRCAQRGLSFLQREVDLSPGFLFLPLLRESENAVDSVPELVEGTRKKRRLIGSAAAGSESGFEAHGVIKIGANALELGRPRGQG